MIDLAARHLGGSVLAASDDSFGPKELLLRPGPVRFVPGTYDHKGEVVDGWETRRRREPGSDWVVVRLGVAGVVRSVDVDTTSFTGNAPAACWVEACAVPGPQAADALTGWEPLVGRTALQPDAHNVLPVEDARSWTHLRVWTHPDGGVGRLRVEGDPLPDPRWLDGMTVDLAGEALGAEVVACTDEHYSAARSLLRPDQPVTMGDGWEARRRRGAGHDSVTIRLALAGHPDVLELDTTHFVHNATPEVTIWGCHAPQDGGTGPAADDRTWTPLLARTRLQPDARHRFRVGPGTDTDTTDAATEADQSLTHVRLDAHPDGGVARLRVVGRVAPAARAAAGVRWFDSLPRPQALVLLRGGNPELVDLRPFTRPDRLLAGLRASGGPTDQWAPFVTDLLGAAP